MKEIQQEAEQTSLVLLRESSEWIKTHREEIRKKHYISPVEAWAQHAYVAAAKPRDAELASLKSQLEGGVFSTTNQPIDSILKELEELGCNDIRLRKYSNLSYETKGRFGGYPIRKGQGSSYEEALGKLKDKVELDRKKWERGSLKDVAEKYQEINPSDWSAEAELF